jgi:hypothetical protein
MQEILSPYTLKKGRDAIKQLQKKLGKILLDNDDKNSQSQDSMGNEVGGSGKAEGGRSLADCFLIYNFLSKQLDFNQVLVEDLGINSAHVAFFFDSKRYTISVETSKTLFTKI